MREICQVLDMDPAKVLRIRASAVLQSRAALSDLSPRHDEDPTPMRMKGVKTPEHAFMPKPAA